MVLETQAEATKEQITNELITWLKATGDFVSEQSPLIIQDILTAGIIEHSLWVMFLMILRILILRMLRLTGQKNWDDLHGEEELQVFCLHIFSWLALLICSIALTINFFYILVI